MTDIQSAISVKLGQNRNFIKSIIQGEANPRDILTYEMYESLYRIRHDAVHWLICQHRDLPFGEISIEESFKLYPEISQHKLYHLIKNQTPDIIKITGKSVHITELTISRMKAAEIRKYTKYHLLCQVIKESGFDVNLEVIAINTLQSVPDRSFLISEHKFSDELIDRIFSVIKNVDELLHGVNEKPEGVIWHAKFRNLTMDKVDLPFSNEDVISFYNNSKRKTFNDESDLRSVLDYKSGFELTDDDDSFIDFLAGKALGIESPLAKSQDRRQAIERTRKFHDDHKHKCDFSEVRSFMPLPYFIETTQDSSIRQTLNDDDKVEALLSTLSNSRDWFLNHISNPTNRVHKLKIKYSGESVNHKWLFKVKLTMDQEAMIAMDGPGRKKFIRRGSRPHIDKQNHRKNIWYPIDKFFQEEIEDVSNKLSQIESISDDLIPRGIGFQYLTTCQSIFREININALRKERSGKRFILRPTGVNGVFVLIHPGGRLRTGENLSIIWFKLVISKEAHQANHMSHSWVFKRLHTDVTVLHSDWLSTDANRLDHYLRCYDKVLMSYACYCSMSSRSLTDEMRFHQGNTLGIIMMIYMEDRRTTSKMLQDVRYLVMGILSMFNYYGDLLKKFEEPLRSPLQAYLLDRILSFVEDDSMGEHLLRSVFGSVNVEAGTGETFDRLAGASLELPRILTKGSDVNFKQILCEMYFTMLFNKNQDDPTHASFQILTKILEGEASLEAIKSTTKLHTGYQNGIYQDAQVLIDNPHKNQFSRHAIVVGSKLQAAHKMNKANSGIAHEIASTSIQINKYLDEFATYKSSSLFMNEYLNPKIYCRNPNDLNPENKEKNKYEVNTQNPRRRCLEGVLELIEEGCSRSFDLMPRLTKPIRFQIFKKNQIGGVREILILDMEKRILINVLESFSRVICREDDREMLTHGDRKNTLLRDSIRNLKRSTEKRVIMNYNFDKTKWAPSFMPIQFLYMFLPFRDKYPSLFNFICISLMNHSNKEFILPEKLIKAWSNDPTNKYHHLMDTNLQSLKEDFLRTKKLTHLNESNMGQGILHYTSSYFHLCVISLRDEIYKRMCKKMGLDPGEWFDLVSSDDSYTGHALPADSKYAVLKRIHLFLKAQEVTERVMNVWTSPAKSSISLLIYEFNSLFGSNLTMYPTTLKFALAAVHPMNTDSFFRSCKEGFIACRQIVENGGSLELYTLASRLNKVFAESIYHTGTGGQNDLTKFGLRLEYTPYQLGIYPIMDPALMIMFGPECHNYNLLNSIHKMNSREKSIFIQMHTIVNTTDPELFSAMESVDSVFVGVNRIEARMGPIKRLQYIKRRWSVDEHSDEIHEYIMNNPLMLFRKAKDIKELKYKVMLKLYQNSAAEAMRTTAASLYYGRVAATVSAHAFTIPFVTVDDDKKQIKMTYAECIETMINMPTQEVNLELFYPHKEEFDSLIPLTQIMFEYQPRDKLETQNIRQIQLNRLTQRIVNPINNLLQHNWVEPLTADPPSSFIRDWINLKEIVPVLRDSLEQTLENFNGTPMERVKSLLLILMRLMGYSSKPMKAIIYGPSSRSYEQSFLILRQQNQYQDLTSTESHAQLMTPISTKLSDKLCFAFNVFSLSVMKGYTKNGEYHAEPMDVSEYIDDEDVKSFFLNTNSNSAMKKKIMLMLIYHGLLSDVSNWSLKTRTIFHQWINRSKRNDQGIYIGDYILKAQLGHTCLQLIHSKGKYKIEVNQLSDTMAIVELLNYVIDMSGDNQQVFWSKVDKGPYVLAADQLSIATRPIGFQMNTRVLMPVQYQAAKVRSEGGFLVLYDRYNEQIMKTVEGLLHTDYYPKDIDWDIRILGLSLRMMLKIRPFDNNFSIEYCHDNDLLDILSSADEPLRVPRPHVTQITNKRLELDLPLRGLDEEYEEFFSDELDEGQDDEKNFHEPPNLFDFVMSMSDEDATIINNQLLNSGNSLYDSLLDPTFDFTLLKTMSKKRLVYHPKKILERVLFLKYHIIAKMITNVNLINSEVINAANIMYSNPNLSYALIYVYDRLFSSEEMPSPDGCILRINPAFAAKFNLKIKKMVL